MPGGPHSRGGNGSRFLYEPFSSAVSDEELQYRAILRSLGTPEQLAQKIKAVDDLIEDKRRRDWLFHSIKAVAVWAAAVATGWLAFQGLISDFLAGLQP